MIDLINEIINNKWNELESQSKEARFDQQVAKLLDIIISLDTTNDFIKEYEKYKEEISKKIDVLTEDQIDELLENFYQKWTFIMCAILNLDMNNPYVLIYMQETLTELTEMSEG